MKATEARKLSKKSAKTVVITPYLTAIYGKIKEAAAKGETSITLEYHMDVAGAGAAALRKQLRKDGYEIVFHDDPDPGDPYSGGCYETINW